MAILPSSDLISGKQYFHNEFMDCDPPQSFEKFLIENLKVP